MSTARTFDPSAPAYRPDIDGLRAVAVSAVVAYHAFPSFIRGGFIGVDIFFVISGFLISRIIFEALEEKNFSYLQFYNRRIRRIFPALILVCGVALLFGWYALLPDEFQRLGKHLASGAAFVSNFTLWNESGYFDAAADSKPLLHLWSLAIEEQFYIIWPILLGLVWRRKRGFLLVTLLVGLASFGVNIGSIAHQPHAAFYSPLSRFWELMIGGVLAYLSLHRPDLLRPYAGIRATAGLLLIAAGIVFLTKDAKFPGYWALLPTIGAFLIISAGAETWPNRRILSSRPFIWIGLISYPLYLWHWPILVFSKLVKGLILSTPERFIAIAASIVMAYLTYELLEKPLRGIRSMKLPVGLAASMAGIAIFGLLALHSVVPARLKADNISQILSAAYDWQYPPATAQAHVVGPLRYFVESNGLDNTLFVGDSNMEQYAPRVDRVIKDHPLTSNGAIFIGNQSECTLTRELFTSEHACDPTVAVLHELIDRPSTKAVAVAASWLKYKYQILDPQNQERFCAFLRYAGKGHRLYLILNIPSGEELAPTSMFAGSRLTQISTKSIDSLHFDMRRFEGKFGEINSILRKIGENAGATVIDPVEHLCPQRQCPFFDQNGVPLYLDASHLTRAYALSSAGYVDATLAPLN